MNYKLLEGWKKSRVTRCLVKTCLGVVNEDVFRRGKTPLLVEFHSKGVRIKAYQMKPQGRTVALGLCLCLFSTCVSG